MFGKVLWFAGLFIFAGCLGIGPPVYVDPGVVTPPASNDLGLRAAVREVDITPPPGLPIYGYSSEGAREAKGFWMRLKARVVVLDDGYGGRVALVQADLGAASALLHRKVASALSEAGIGLPELMLTASHTHGGPGGFFGHRFYNAFVGAQPAFEPRFVDWLSDRISREILAAIDDLQPAQVTVGTASVPSGAASNRSVEAWRSNFDVDGSDYPEDEVGRDLVMLRIDSRPRVETEVEKLLGVWLVYGVHGTSMPSSYDLYHGDVHGALSRLTAAAIKRKCGVDNLVVAAANGAAGDVSPGGPGSPPRGKHLTLSAARLIAEAAVKAFGQCRLHRGESYQDIRIRSGFREVSLRSAGTRRGRLCAFPSLGAPQLGGSEEGRGPLYGFLDMYEGAVRPPSGCDGTKVKALGCVQDAVLKPDDLPDVVPFQVIGLFAPSRGGTKGDRPVLLFAGVPGEPTTELGRRITGRIADVMPAMEAEIAVVSMSNGYSNYFTTPQEFLKQSYEGGATLYGPYQGVLAEEQLSEISIGLARKDRKIAIDYRRARTFWPGTPTEYFPENHQCETSPWIALGTNQATGSFTWRGSPRGKLCDYPLVSMDCRDDSVTAEAELGLEVRQTGVDTWTATWDWRLSKLTDGPCRILVKGDSVELQSAPIVRRHEDATLSRDGAVSEERGRR